MKKRILATNATLFSASLVGPLSHPALPSEDVGVAVQVGLSERGQRSN